MIVKPKLRLDMEDLFTDAFAGLRSLAGAPPTGQRKHPAEGVAIIPSHSQDGVFVQCVAVQPKSSEGKNVTLWLDPETVDLLLKELRDNAIARRR